MTEHEVVYQTLPKYTVPVLLGLIVLACLACDIFAVVKWMYS